MDKKKNSASHLLSRFRSWVQAAATLLTNVHLPNFVRGGIYQGAGKTVCVPGLNCYSCPAASGACPIGSFQAVVGSSKFNFSYYVASLFNYCSDKSSFCCILRIFSIDYYCLDFLSILITYISRSCFWLSFLI